MRIPVSSYEPSRARIPLLGWILDVRCFHRVWIVGDRGVNSFWRTSEIRAGIILEAAYQSQVRSHTYCLLCSRLGMLQAP